MTAVLLAPAAGQVSALVLGAIVAALLSALVLWELRTSGRGSRALRAARGG